MESLASSQELEDRFGLHWLLVSLGPPQKKIGRLSCFFILVLVDCMSRSLSCLFDFSKQKYRELLLPDWLHQCVTIGGAPKPQRWLEPNLKMEVPSNTRAKTHTHTNPHTNPPSLFQVGAANEATCGLAVASP